MFIDDESNFVKKFKLCQIGMPTFFAHDSWRLPMPSLSSVALFDRIWFWMLQARSQDRFGGGGAQNPKKVDLLDPKSGLFEPHPLNPPTKTPFLAHFVAKSGPLGRFGGCFAPPGYGPGMLFVTFHKLIGYNGHKKMVDSIL